MIFIGTNFYINDKLTFCVPFQPIKFSNTARLITDFLNATIFTVLCLICVATLMWLSNNILPDNNYYKSYLNALITVVRLMLSPSTRHKMVFSGCRIAFASGLILSFYFNIIYSSWTTSNLMDARYKQKYGSLKSIFEYNLTTYYGPNCYQYFQDSGSKKIRQHWKDCINYVDCLHDVAFKRDRTYSTAYMIMRDIQKNYVSINNEPLIYCFGNLMNFMPTMYFSPGSVFAEKFNYVLTHFRNSGIIVKWIKESLFKDLDSIERSNINLHVDEGSSIRFKHLVPILKIIFYFIVLSVFVFLAELVVHRVQKFRQYIK